MRATSSIVLTLLLSGLLFSQTEADSNSQKLKLTTTILQQKYCDSDYLDMAMLGLSLHLTYTNVGERSLILYRGSNLLSYVLVGSNEQKLKNKQFEENMHVGWLTSGTQLNEGSQPGKEFVVLNPNESYQTEGDVSIPIDLDGTTQFLKPGGHVLQVVAETWPADEALFDKLRTKWNNTGVLWGKNVRSEPMPFKVEKRPKVVGCK